MAIKKLKTSNDDVIGNYRILRLLGRGGMGEVYLAWTGLRLVAIKILNPQHANDAEFVAMFLAEARLAARLNHTGIASVLDVGEHDGRIFMVMEYVAGQTLDELLRDPAIPGLLPLRIACAAFANVAQALGAAHRAQIVHRDISPHNLLVSFTGAVKIIDFGIARTQSGDSHTSPGTMRGRFGYMAPEYVQGLVCDHRVDLFALGVVMWETFARQRLYAGTAAAQMFAMVERPAERLDELIAGFPIELADIVARLLQREPTLRYAQATDVANALVELLPQLPDDGFRNLEHWVTHHLGQRIEARGRTDREALMQFTSEEMASRATGELPALRVLRPLTVDGERTAVEWAPLEGGAAGEGEDASVVIEQSSGVPQVVTGRSGEGLSGRATMTGMGTMGRIIATMEGTGPTAGTAGAAAMGTGVMARGGEQLMGAPAAAAGTGVANRPRWATKMGLTELLDERRGLMLVAALSAVVVVLSLWLGLRGEWRARRAETTVMAAGMGGMGRGGEGRTEAVAPSAAARGDVAAAGGATTAVDADAMTAAGPAAIGAGAVNADAVNADAVNAGAVNADAMTAAGPTAGVAGAADAGDGEVAADEPEIELEPEDNTAAPSRGRTGRAATGKGTRAAQREAAQRLAHKRDEEKGKGDKPAARGGKDPAEGTASVQAGTPEPRSDAPPAAAPRPPAVDPAPPPAAPRPATTATTGPITPTVPAVTPPTPPRTPRVPASLLGDEGRGVSVVGRCNGCHSQSKARRVEGKQMTRSQWERFFRNGNHDRNLPLGGSLNVNELADAKAFLMSRALDSSFDQGAGVR